jgi:DNA repair exonuclease SbcCD ATPase subunit
MKIQELEISNVRGIRYLLLKPDCKNLVIWGPNGSGKSAVVDSVDFLLTGNIRRLTGIGSGDLSLIKHGPHIGCAPEDTYVRAKVVLASEDEPIEISRSFKKPKILICDEKDKARLDLVLELAFRGHHVLTRKEILEYITSEGNKRAESIQKILNLSEIEKIRKNLVSVQTDFQRIFDNAQHRLASAKSDLALTLSMQAFDTGLVLRKINEIRALWVKEQITSLNPEEIKNGINLPQVETGAQTINTTMIHNQINKIINGFQQHENVNETQIRVLENKILTCHSNPKLLKDVSSSEFIKHGISLITDSGECPLCETPWTPGELIKYLSDKLANSIEGKKLSDELDLLRKELKNNVEQLITGIDRLYSVTISQNGFESENCFLVKWKSNLNMLLSCINSSSFNYDFPHYTNKELQGFFNPENGKGTLSSISEKLAIKFPNKTPEQTAWDTLTSVETNVKNLQSAQLDFEKAKIRLDRSVLLLIEFENARDTVLTSLYSSISARFADLYRKLHGDDEKEFNAVLKPCGPALEFAVDFYGTGVQPPNAMHSEGHQDSMGLCLYLALAEKLTSSTLDLIVWDDVVMSVDSEHRKSLCKLLKEEFPDKQFLITTHDKIWSSQLQHESVVNNKNLIEFFNWSIATGPIVNTEIDVWNLIKIDLEQNHIPEAAARLRRAAESYFSEVCEDLHASIRYKSDARWELGELLSAAISAYKKTIKDAIKAARSWEDEETRQRLTEINEGAEHIFLYSEAEKWAINPNVHFSPWANFSREDFIPVVESYQDLFGVFRCNKCNSPLTLTMNGLTKQNLRCKCSNVNINLVCKE